MSLLCIWLYFKYVCSILKLFMWVWELNSDIFHLVGTYTYYISKLYWSFVRDLFIHSPMTLTRNICSNLQAEPPPPSFQVSSNLPLQICWNLPAEIPPPVCRVLQICHSKSASRGIYTSDLLPAMVTMLFNLCWVSILTMLTVAEKTWISVAVYRVTSD